MANKRFSEAYTNYLASSYAIDGTELIPFTSSDGNDYAAYLSDLLNVDTYIDLSAAVEGDGTQSKPLNWSQVQTEFSSLKGDQNGKKFFFKKGSSASGQLGINGAYNFLIGAYGTGALPVIDAQSTELYAMYFQACYDFFIDSMEFVNGVNHSLSIVSLASAAPVKNINLTNLVCSGAGGGSGQDGINIDCGSFAGTGVSIYIGSCTVNDNSNNAIELSAVDGVIVEDCTFTNNDNNALELWRECKNVMMRRCIHTAPDPAAGTGRLIWNADKVQTGGISNHENITVQNCTSQNSPTTSVRVEDTDGFIIENCSIKMINNTSQPSMVTIYVANSSPTTIINNIIWTPPHTAGSARQIRTADTASEVNFTCESNIYMQFSDLDSTINIESIFRNTAAQPAFSDWQATYGHDLNGLDQNDPLWVDASIGNFELGAASPARYNSSPASGYVAVANALREDILGRTRGIGQITCGAYQDEE